MFFQAITGLMISWEKEIFEFYKDRLTNAYTEAMNNQFKKYYSNAVSCGFELLRAVFLYQTFFDDNAARRKAAQGCLGRSGSVRGTRLCGAHGVDA